MSANNALPDLGSSAEQTKQKRFPKTGRTQRRSSDAIHFYETEEFIAVTHGRNMGRLPVCYGHLPWRDGSERRDVKASSGCEPGQLA
jgi:hypothetical protein